MKELAINFDSIGTGAIYLPFDVLKISFNRPVMVMYPSLSIEPLSPVFKYPSSVIASAVFSGSR